MNSWLPPYRIGVLKNDPIALQAITMALDKNPNWEIVYTETFWESGLFAVNCGLHAIYLNDSLQANDISLELFDQIRFFACRKLPLPYLLVKTSSETANFSNYPLTRPIKSIGITNSIKTELTNIAQEISSKNSPFSKYAEYQFYSFISGKIESPGGILTTNFPNNYLMHAQVWACIMEKKMTDGENILNEAISQQPFNAFFQATAAMFYYHQKKIDQAREKLDLIANDNNNNPFLLYLVFNLVDQFNDFQIQYAIARILEQKFPNSYVTFLSMAIWNARIGDHDLAIIQLLGCLEKLPQDLFAAAELVKLLSLKKYTGVFSGVKNYASSYLLKSSLSQYMYSNLLGIKN